MAHLTGFGLENFRVFNEVTWFDFAPITVLTGTNSSGKSSLLKSIKLFNYNMKSKSQEKNRENIIWNIDRLDFSDHDHFLGSFENIINKEDKSDDLVFTIPFIFHGINDKLEIKFTYRIDSSNILKNGILTGICLQTIKKNKKIIFVEKETTQVEGKKRTYSKFAFEVEYFREKLDSAIIDQKAREKQISQIKEELKKLEGEEYMGLFLIPKPALFVENLVKYINRNKDNVKNDKDRIIYLNLLIQFLESTNLQLNDFDEFMDLLLKNKLIQFPESSFNLLTSKVSEKYKINELLFNVHEFINNNEFKNFINEFVEKNNKNGKISIQSIIKRELEYLKREFCSEVKIEVGHDESLLSIFSNFLNKMIFSIYRINEFGADNKFHFYDHGNADIFIKDFVFEGLNKGLGKIKEKFESIQFLDSIRANTQRLYTNQEQGSGFNKLLLDFERVGFSKESEEIAFINEMLNIFKIGNELYIERDSTDVGSKVFIINKGEKILLADLGYGITQILPILLKIALLSYDDNDTKTLIIEEPETNLHPQYQSLLAYLFIEAAKIFNIQFIIETHSEYLIRKLQFHTAKGEIKPEDSIIYYFHHPDQIPKGQKQVKRINILEDGSLSDNFGPGFFDEAANLVSSIWEARSKN